MELKMRNLALTREKKKGFIVDIHNVLAISNGENKRFSVKFANGKINYVSTFSDEQTQTTTNYFNGRTRKQAKDAADNIEKYQERLEIVKNISVFLISVTTVFLALTVLGASVPQIRLFIMDILKSNNGLAYVGSIVPATAVSALLALNSARNREKDLRLVEKFKMFFDNEEDLSKYGRIETVQIDLSNRQRAKLKKVLAKEDLNISNLKVLSIKGLETLVSSIAKYKEAEQQGNKYQYSDDTIGIDIESDEDENSGEELVEEPLVLEHKPKKRFRLFGSRS